MAKDTERKIPQILNDGENLFTKVGKFSLWGDGSLRVFSTHTHTHAHRMGGSVYNQKTDWNNHFLRARDLSVGACENSSAVPHCMAASCVSSLQTSESAQVGGAHPRIDLCKKSIPDSPRVETVVQWGVASVCEELRSTFSHVTHLVQTAESLNASLTGTRVSLIYSFCRTRILPLMLLPYSPLCNAHKFLR